MLEEMRELIQTSVREVLPSLLEGALASASRSPGTAVGNPHHEILMVSILIIQSSYS